MFSAIVILALTHFSASFAGHTRYSDLIQTAMLGIAAKAAISVPGQTQCRTSALLSGNPASKKFDSNKKLRRSNRHATQHQKMPWSKNH
jgi:hypothetical protein